MFNLFKRKKNVENQREQEILKNLVMLAKDEKITQYQVTITKLNEHKFNVKREEVKNVNLGNSNWESSFTNLSTFYV